MSEKKAKKPLYQTPAGEAVWPWINKYDDRPIKGKPQKPAYKLNIRYDAKDPSWLELKAKLDVLVDAAYDEAVKENPKKKKQIVKQYPYAMETDDDGEETGKVIFKLKQSAFIKSKKEGEPDQLVTIAKFDAKGKPLPKGVVVYGGSVVKASFSTRPYLVDSTNGAGVSCDLKAVQVLHLVSSSERSASSYGFGEEEGYEVEEEESETTTTTDAEDSEASGDETDPTKF